MMMQAVANLVKKEPSITEVSGVLSSNSPKLTIFGAGFQASSLLLRVVSIFRLIP